VLEYLIVVPCEFQRARGYLLEQVPISLGVFYSLDRELFLDLDEVLGLVWVKFSCHGRAWRKRRMGIKQEGREKERSEVVFQRESGRSVLNQVIVVVIRVRMITSSALASGLDSCGTTIATLWRKYN